MCVGLDGIVAVIVRLVPQEGAGIGFVLRQ
jgi:hypothetical protein